MENGSSDIADRDRWVTRGWVPLLIAVVLFAMSSGGHVRRSVDPGWFNDDARQQVWPFLRIHDPQLFPDDPVADYYLKVLPTGYQAIYRFTAPLVDPRVTSKVLPYLLLGALLAGIWVACNAISGRMAAWLGVYIVLATGVPLQTMSGGLPRSFAIALVALAAAAIATHSPRWLAATAVAGAAIYPATGVLLGLALGLYAVVWPGLRSAETGRRNVTAGIVLTLVTALACLAVLAVPLLGSAEYGGGIGPDEYDAYPEAGPGGRSNSHDSVDGPAFPIIFRRSVEFHLWQAGVRGPAKLPVSIVVTTLVMLVGALVVKRRPAFRGLLCLLCASAIAYHAAQIFFPLLFWPGRYVNFFTLIFVFIVGAVGLTELVAWLRKTDLRDGATRKRTILIALPLLIAMAAVPGKRSGLAMSAHPGQPFFDFVASLPADALLAGWPTGRLESVRLVSARRVLVDYENHLAFHRGYIELMRPRAALSIEASLSHTDEALRRLHAEYGVTHFVIRLRSGNRPPRYFDPFNELIGDTFEARGDRPPAADVLIDDAAVYRDKGYAVLDLDAAFSR